jgi:hypothetical protein
MLTNATATGASAAFQVRYANRMTFQASGTTTAGAGAATVKIQVSNDGANWLDLGTISLTLSTTSSSDGFAAEAPWQFVRANITAISGTGASVNVQMSTN